MVAEENAASWATKNEPNPCPMTGCCSNKYQAAAPTDPESIVETASRREGSICSMTVATIITAATRARPPVEETMRRASRPRFIVNVVISAIRMMANSATSRIKPIRDPLAAAAAANAVAAARPSRNR